MNDSSDSPSRENEESAAPAFPSEGALLGLDFGTKRVGVAVSTPSQTISSPLEVYYRQSEAQDAEYLRTVVKDYRVVGLVVGLPVHMSGDEGGLARQAREFGEWAAGVTGLPLRYWDERYSSATAEQHLLGADLSKKKRKRRIDMLAAQIILQAFLNAPDRDRKPQSM